MFSFETIVNEVPIKHLTNTKRDPFFFSNRGLTKFYDHEKGKVNDLFWDGNNADEFVVVAINATNQRMIIRNLTQGGFSIVWWE